MKYKPAYTVEEFLALSPGEARRAVAQDALKQLQINRMKAAGCYMEATLAVDGLPDDGADVRELLLQIEKPCYVCALGAVFTSAVCLGDNIKTERRHFFGNFSPETVYSVPSGVMKGHLCGLFERHQLELIEAAYEEWQYELYDGEEHLSQLRCNAYHFGYQYIKRPDRLHAILTLMAEHPEGLFDPPHHDMLPNTSHQQHG